MYMKNLYSFITVIFISVLFTGFIFPVNASANTAATSAALIPLVESEDTDDIEHIKTLQAFLAKKNSPLAPYAKTFVDEAKKNNLDWRLVAAISGLESSFGIHIPTNSYNGWGFGVYGDNVRRFESWDDGITVVSTALRKDYMNKWGATSVAEIGRIYAASPTWAVRVQYFIN